MKEKIDPKEYLSQISVDPHQVHSKDQCDKVWQLLRKYHTVFNGDISVGYNGASGPSTADFNFQTENSLMENKGYFPRYSHDEELILQGICDYYEELGIMQDPQALNIPIKHVSPLLLVQKPHTKVKLKEELTIKDYRLVGFFNALKEKIKAIPISRPKPDHVFQFAASCKYLFKTDADTYFYQLWAEQSKWPYLMVQTPFRGKRIITRAVMGVKGMSECADAHMSKVLQNMIINDQAVQDHDDIVNGGGDFDTALRNLETLIVTVKNMRSFIGLFKVFFKAHPNQAWLLASLEQSCAGEESKKHIVLDA